MSNLYYQELVNNKWRKKRWSGPVQYEDPTGELMMLPTDLALIWDRKVGGGAVGARVRACVGGTKLRSPATKQARKHPPQPRPPV
jgi:hypothetical protein